MQHFLPARKIQKEVDLSYINIISPENADPELQEVYRRLLSSRGKISNIMAVQSLHPKAMEAHLNLYMALMFSPGGLKRAQREMIAVWVSRLNKCDYCIQHHRAALMAYWKDEKKMAAFLNGYQKAALSPAEERMLAYCEKLTLNPHEISESDILELRESGFTEKQILEMNMITAYFNFVNRIALGLGVTFSEDEVDGYKY